MINPTAEFTTKLASRSQVWPCALWDHVWTKTFSVSEMGFGEFLSVTHPDLIAGAHRELLKAGATALVTNTFGANRLGMEDYGKADMVEEVNVESGRLALSAALEVPDEDRPLVFGSLGPTFEVRRVPHFSRVFCARSGVLNLSHTNRCWSSVTDNVTRISLVQFN